MFDILYCVPPYNQMVDWALNIKLPTFLNDNTSYLFFALSVTLPNNIVSHLISDVSTGNFLNDNTDYSNLIPSLGIFFSTIIPVFSFAVSAGTILNDSTDY